MYRIAIVLWALLLLSVQSVAASVSPSATIFVYHRFGDQRYPSTNVEITVFEAQLDYLKKNHFHVLTAGEIARRLKADEALPERCVALTVDDAYRSFLTGAMPLLRRYGYPVTLFVNTAAVGAGSYLTWDELRELHAEGVEIGNHSSTHPYFVSKENMTLEQWHEWARADLVEAQQQCQQELGDRPALLAYPYGEYSPELMDLAAALDFDAAFAQQSGPVGPTSARYALPRFPMGGAYATLNGFRSKLMMRPLPVEVLSPQSPLIAQQNDPPELLFRLDCADVAISTLKCYVQGQDQPAIEVVDKEKGVYRVRALGPLAGRRNKYTLTAQSRDSRYWYWFSQLWIHP
ncbi:MAG: polysaccharide deacetylase family protein [Desulfuromonadaceae bacterium]|nr:polysaccharide deacetylase family protein [Desulfuromonadaceae bacterium]